MGLIREPKNVDFTVIDKPWTVKEKAELSKYIQEWKAKNLKKKKKTKTRKKAVKKKKAA